MSIKRLTFLLCGILLSCPCAGAASESDSVSLPGEGGTLPAVEYPYFPDRQHAFVWRNWTSVPAARLAEVLATSEENVNRLAASMGLRPQRGIEPYWSDARGYITVLRSKIQTEKDRLLLRTNKQLVIAAYNYWNW